MKEETIEVNVLSYETLPCPECGAMLEAVDDDPDILDFDGESFYISFDLECPECGATFIGDGNGDQPPPHWRQREVRLRDHGPARKREDGLQEHLVQKAGDQGEEALRRG